VTGLTTNFNKIIS